MSVIMIAGEQVKLFDHFMLFYEDSEKVFRKGPIDFAFLWNGQVWLKMVVDQLLLTLNGGATTWLNVTL